VGQGALFLAFAALAQPQPASLGFRDAISVKGSTLTLGDVADLNRLPLSVRDKASALVLMSVDKRRRGQLIPHGLLAARARALMPGLKSWFSGRYVGQLQLNPPRGDYVRIVASGNDAGAVDHGDKLMVRLQAGPISISRPAHALQSAKAGERFFVRTSDGVIAATCCGDR
jgi:hypothetical protein